MMSRRAASSLGALLLVVTLTSAADVAVTRADLLEDARLAIRTKQFPRAVELLRSQAHEGVADAQYLLGLAQWNGVGLEPDREAARASLKLAANGGHAAAAYALAALLGTGTSADRKEAAQWLTQAAAAGYAPAVALQSTHAFALADARMAPGLAAEFRFEIARAAARDDDAALLAAAGVREFVHRRGDFGRTLLFEAARSGAAETTRVLLGSGADAEARDEYGETPLMLAAAQPVVAVTRVLLASGGRADSADKVGRTALFRAAAADRPEQIAALLAAGATVGQADQRGWTAFDVAQQGNCAAALDELRAGGGRPGGALLAAPRGATGIDATRPGTLYQGWPPVAIAAARDDAADIRRRKAAGADLEAITPQGEAALQIAINSHADDAVRVLIELGANPDRKGSDGMDALERIVRAGDATLLTALAGMGVKFGESGHGAGLVGVAVRRGDAAMTRALLAAGLSAATSDAIGMTPLMYAARSGDVEMIQLLLDRGARPAPLDTQGRSALHYAAAAGSSRAVAVLLAVQAPVGVADRSGTTPLIAAIRGGSVTTVERLLAAGAAVDGKEPPLTSAAAAGRVDIVAALLSRKPAIDAVDAFGDTALMTAARNGDEATSTRLLAAGANARLRNRERATAADLAEARGYAALAQRLRD